MANDKTVLEMILDELKDMRKDMNNMSNTQAQQHITLQDHTRRSEALEKLYELVRSELEPVKKHVAMVDGALKFIGLIGVIVGIITGIVSLIS